MRPGRLDLEGGRWVPFVHTLTMRGVDLTGATFAMQVRLTGDASGSALVDLATVATAAEEGVRLIYGGTDTIDNHIAAGRLSEVPDGSAGGDSLALTQLGIRINETTMEGLPFPTERGDDATLAWDMHITPSGALKQVWLEGSFTVKAGVTQ